MVIQRVLGFTVIWLEGLRFRDLRFRAIWLEGFRV